MHRHLHTLAFMTLLALATCTKTNNNVGSVRRDGGSGGTQHPYVGSDASCVNYPNSNTVHRVFPFDPALQGGQQWPTCTLNCNAVLATAGNSQAPLDQALPDGPCDDEGATCNSPVMAGWCPPCINAGGPGNVYTCTCRAQQWKCALVSQGGSMCDLQKCVNPSLTFPNALSCSQASWSATQVCICGICQDLCSSDADCQSGRCTLNQVCRTLESCSDPYACFASCTGLCAPAVSDGGLGSVGGQTGAGGNTGTGGTAIGSGEPADAQGFDADDCASWDYGPAASSNPAVCPKCPSATTPFTIDCERTPDVVCNYGGNPDGSSMGAGCMCWPVLDGSGSVDGGQQKYEFLCLL